MRIMMVCLGNICRSPLAQGIMEHLVNEHHLDWIIDSSGTSGWHNGEKPHRDSIAIAKKHGIDISGQRSAQFSMYDFDEYDHIIVMDRSNFRDVQNLARTPEDIHKIHLLLHYGSSDKTEVPDPYYEGGFDKVYDLIYDACQDFIQKHSGEILEES